MNFVNINFFLCVCFDLLRHEINKKLLYAFSLRMCFIQFADWQFICRWSLFWRLCSGFSHFVEDLNSRKVEHAFVHSHIILSGVNTPGVSASPGLVILNSRHHITLSKPSLGDPHQPLKFVPCSPKHLWGKSLLMNKLRIRVIDNLSKTRTKIQKKDK